MKPSVESSFGCIKKIAKPRMVLKQKFDRIHQVFLNPEGCKA
jgi:hypothetical protein